MNLRFHGMFPKGGEVAMKTAQETSRVLTTKSMSPAALPDMEGWVRFARSVEEAGIEAEHYLHASRITDAFDHGPQWAMVTTDAILR
jgi:hypothetical protein